MWRQNDGGTQIGCEPLAASSFSCCVSGVVASLFACQFAFAACSLASVSLALAFGCLVAFLARLVSFVGSPSGLVSFVTLFAVPPLLSMCDSATSQLVCVDVLHHVKKAVTIE